MLSFLIKVSDNSTDSSESSEYILSALVIGIKLSALMGLLLIISCD